MFHTRSRTIAAVATGTLLLAPLAGCGGDDGKDAGKTSSSSSSSSTDDSEPASSGDSVDVDTFVQTLVDAMSEKRTAKMVIELGSSMTATADVDYAASGTQMSMKMTTGSQKVQVVLADGTMYLQQSAGGKFLKIDKNDPALGSLLDQLGNIGPKASVTAMKSGIKKIEDLGTETVDGDELTHYALTVDTAKAMAGFGAPAGTEDDGPGTIVYDLYTDDDNLMREVRMVVSGQKLVMKVSGWGDPVDIKVPTAAQITAR